MGDDFAYENANTWYKQIDKLIHYVNMVLFFSKCTAITGFVRLMRQLESPMFLFGVPSFQHGYQGLLPVRLLFSGLHMGL